MAVLHLLSVYIVLLHSVPLTVGLDFKISPTPVSPGGRIVLNCTLPTSITDSYQLRIKDQDNHTLVLYYKGHTSLKASGLTHYKDRISKINHPDQTITWASFEYHVPWCYQYRQFTCYLLDHVIVEQSTQNLTIQPRMLPNLYRDGSCLTCSTPVVPLVLDSVNDTSLECRLDGVTEASRLVWSNNYFVIPETNITFNDSEKCIYNHTSTATASRSHPPGETVNVSCTAVTSQGNLKSLVLQVKIGRNDAEDMENEDTLKSLTIGITIGCTVVFVLVVAGLVFTQRELINRTYQQGKQLPSSSVMS